MQMFFPAVFYASLLALAGCDEIAVANDPVALAEVRGSKSCISAVKKQTGASSATLNTTLPVVELNRYIIDVAGAKSWICVTDNTNKAIEIVEITT